MAAKLGTLGPGKKGTIVAIDPDLLEESSSEEALALSDRLREIGFAEDLDIEVTHQSLFGKDPISVNIGASSVGLRRREANIILVDVE